MVFLSESTAASAVILFIGLAFTQFRNEAARIRRNQGRNHASLLTTGMLQSYAITRLLLETETPQSVIPVFLAVVLFCGEIIRRGEYYLAEFVLQYTTIYVVTMCLLIFTSVKGFTFLSAVARSFPLDRSLEWYHVILIGFSSWRWFLINFMALLPVLRGKFGWLLMAVKIAVVWIVCKVTGNKVATSPWGAFDEILLEKNSLIYLILGLISFAVVMDQISAGVLNLIEKSGSTDAIVADKFTWDEVKEFVFDRLAGKS